MNATPECAILHRGAMRLELDPQARFTQQLAPWDAEIGRIWADEQRRNPTLYDAMLFYSTSFNVEHGVAVIRGDFVRYSQHMAAKRDPRIPLGGAAVGVSGLLLVARNGVEHTVLGTRQASAATSAGRLELVPSGGIDTSCLGPDGVPNHQAMLLAELEEETGILATKALCVVDFLLVQDRETNILDLCQLIRLAPEAMRRMRLADGGGEYEELHVLPLAQALEKLEAGPCVAASRTMLQVLLHQPKEET